MKKLLLSFILIPVASFTASAQCTESYTSSGPTPAATGYVAGQSFTAPCSGVLNYVQFTAATSGTNTAGTLNIYAGNGTGTIPIYTQSVPAITVTAGSPIQVMISGSVPITNAAQYTFAFDCSLDLNASFSGYAGGDAFQGATNVSPIDVDFEADISVATGIKEVTTKGLIISPNPATNVLNIATVDQIEKVSIFSVNGALVKTGKQNAINVSNLDAGMYLITVQTNTGTTQTRFIKE